MRMLTILAFALLLLAGPSLPAPAAALRSPMPDLAAMGYVKGAAAEKSCRRAPEKTLEVTLWNLLGREGPTYAEDAISVVVVPHKIPSLIAVWLPNGDVTGDQPTEIWVSRNADGYVDYHWRAGVDSGEPSMCDLLFGTSLP